MTHNPSHFPSQSSRLLPTDAPGSDRQELRARMGSRNRAVHPALPGTTASRCNRLSEALGPARQSLVIPALAALLVIPALAQAQSPTYSGLNADEFLKRWLVAGPIPVEVKEPPSEADQKAAFGQDLLDSAGGEPGVEPSADETFTVGGKVYSWRFVESDKDFVNLQSGDTTEDFSVAYAWAAVEMPEARKGLLGVGSDDGVKVWLNGKLIHENWIGRPVRPDDDVVPVDFQEGKNTLLLKIQNMEGEWGFVCRLLGPATQARKLIAAAREGDLDGAKFLLDRGVDVNARNPAGLTAVQFARLRGQREMVTFLAGAGADAGEPIPPREALTDKFLTSTIEHDGPGASVLVARDGNILFEKGYGLANLEHDVPVTPETKFRIGSISKQFTAAAILKLAEEGKLSVQDNLSKFIPDYPRGNEVTIHHLLTHTSGIHSYTSKPEFLETVTVGAEPENHINSFKNDPYDFDPGQQWSYNNSGYFLLGYIVEKVSGQSYAEYLRSTFFEPLEMNDTGVHEATAILTHEATGYALEGTELKKALNWDMSKAGGAGALYSTVGDLYKWNEAVFNGEVLNAETLKAAFTPVSTDGEETSEPKDSGYGYGWGIQKFRGSQEIGHGGGLHGFLSHLMRLPDKNFTVAVLVNASPPPPGADPAGLAHELVELWLGEDLLPRETPAVDTNVDADSFDSITGRYDYGFGILTVTREEDKVFAQLTGQPKFEIFPKSETEFFWKVVEAEVRFEKNDKGEVTMAVHKQGGQTINAPKLEDIEEAEVDPALYDAYAGRYDYGAGQAILTVTREADRLFAQLTSQPKFQIFPKSETEFFWKNVNARVTFVKDESGKVVKAVHEQSGRKFDAPRMD